MASSRVGVDIWHIRHFEVIKSLFRRGLNRVTTKVIGDEPELSLSQLRAPSDM